MYGKILVPIDGSAPSNSGLREAIRFAVNQQARLLLVHVSRQHVLAPGYALQTIEGIITESARAASEEVLLEASSLVRQFGLEPEVRLVETALGSTGKVTATEIVAQATEWGADLIIIGTHGRRGLNRFAMGSDAECVIRQTHLPVLLVHGGPAGPLVPDPLCETWPEESRSIGRSADGVQTRQAVVAGLLRVIPHGTS